MTQLVKDPAFSLLWLRSQLWFDPWPCNFCMLRVQADKKKRLIGSHRVEDNCNIYNQLRAQIYNILKALLEFLSWHSGDKSD